MKEKILFAIFALICFPYVSQVSAQIYCSENCFYSEAGKSECKYVVKFEGSNKRVWLKTVSHSDVRSNLNKSKDYYENEVWTDGQNSAYMFEYDSSKSNYKNEVYKRKKTSSRERLNQWGTAYDPFTGMHLGYETYQTGWEYVAISNDKSYMIKWYENLNNYDGEIKGKTEYSRILKDDLLPKSVNYDFLQ